jgi:hypothetical protein
MSEQQTTITLQPADQRLVELLVDEHVRASCRLVWLDERTWAIQGSIPVDGEVILAEFLDREHAQTALELLVAAAEDLAARC